MGAGRKTNAKMNLNQLEHSRTARKQNNKTEVLLDLRKALMDLAPHALAEVKAQSLILTVEWIMLMVAR